MKPKLRYNRNYTVTMISEPKNRMLENCSFTAALGAVAIAVLVALTTPEPRALVESGSVFFSAVSSVVGSGLGS